MFYNLNKMNTASLPKVEDVQKKSQKKLNKLIGKMTNIITQLDPVM